MADKKISALTASTTPLAGTEVLPIVQSGVNKQVNVANLTVGRAITATELTLTTGNLIVSNGKGIDFSATPGTGTSELLNDYEEGTWTPLVQSNFGALTSYTASGTYTKIGNRVCYELQILIILNGTGSGALLYELPFNQAKQHTAIGLNLVTVKSCVGLSVSDTSINNYLFYYDGTYPAANSQQIVVSGTYRI